MKNIDTYWNFFLVQRFVSLVQCPCSPLRISRINWKKKKIKQNQQKWWKMIRNKPKPYFVNSVDPNTINIPHQCLVYQTAELIYNPLRQPNMNLSYDSVYNCTSIRLTETGTVNEQDFTIWNSYGCITKVVNAQFCFCFFISLRHPIANIHKNNL